MYQPKIKEPLIRKLYFLAKREKKKMTHVVNEILEEYLVAEPDPPDEGRKRENILGRAQKQPTSSDRANKPQNAQAPPYSVPLA